VLGLGLLAIFTVIRLEYGDSIPLLSTRWFVHAGQLIAGTIDNPSAFIMALPASAYFWWRGMLLGRAREFNYVHSNVMFGAGSFVILALIWVVTITSDSLRSMAGTIAPYAAAFFFCGLVAMALGNLRNVQKRMRPEEPRTVSFGRWLPIVLSIVGGIVVIGVLIATISSLDIAGAIGQVFHAASGFFSTVVEYVGIAFQYILIPFGWLASGLLMFISFLVRLFGNKTPGQTTGETAGTPPEMPPLPQGNSPDALITALKWTFFVIAMVAVAVLIMRSLDKKTRHKREGKPDFEETRESIWSWRRLFNDLFLFFDRMLARLLPWRKSAASLRLGASSVARAEEPIATLKIREVFRHFLRDAAKAGVPWRHSETPFEYARRFAEATPEAGHHLSELTAMYVNVRYSTAEPGEGEVARANSLWRHIREVMKQAKQAER